MEGLIILVLLIILGLIALLLWAVVKVASLSNIASDLRARLERLEVELHQIKNQVSLTNISGSKEPLAHKLEPELKPGVERPRPPSPAVASSPPPVLPTHAPIAPPAPTVPKPIPASAPTPSFARQTPPPVQPPPARPTPINWEQFMGVKLFAWIGGFALFLGVAFFVKYSFDNNLVSPQLRVALSFLTGIGLLVGGVVLKKRDYAVTAQTLCATGIVILYAAAFACHSVYRFPWFSLLPTFLLMTLITATAFLLAARMEAQVVAVLGLVGGFLTPMLLGSNVDNPLGLFGYIALLDVGLVAVGLNRRWTYLLLLGAIGTIGIQVGWVAKFFEPAKVFVAMGIFLGFDLLFLLAFGFAARRLQSDAWNAAATIAVSFMSLGFVFYLLTIPEISRQPPVLFTFMFGADVCLLALALLEIKLHPVHLVSGLVAFLLLSIWMIGYLTLGLLNWALGISLLFAILHTIYPLVLQRLRPGIAPVWWGHFFPPLALLLVMLPMFKFTELTWLLWPCVLLIDLLAIGLAALTASISVIIAVLLLTVAVTATWILRIPVVLADVPEILFVIGGFAVFFFVAGLFAERKVFGTIGEALGSRPGPDPILQLLGITGSPDALRAQIPALSAVFPFMLLIMVITRLPLTNPSSVFGLALLMNLLLLGSARAFKLDALAAVSLGCTFALEFSWYQQRFQPTNATLPLLWFVGFFLMFAAFPFLFRTRFEGRSLPWITAALAGPAHFYLVHSLIKIAYPTSVMGLVPAAFALPALLSLVAIVRNGPVETRLKLSLLAWFGGVALLFITLIFPIQFERQWITIGWALEGVALLWLFHRVPHPGLPIAGVALLAGAFVRLALNPAVLAYHPRTTAPILNWYLYAYGVVTICLFVGAWFLRPPQHLVLKMSQPAILITLGASLAFLLLNIEIADYFTSPGTTTLTFEFSGNFGRDMTYTIAWALYALVLLIAGIWKQVRPARYAGLVLLSVTLIKLFFHDLVQLGSTLYRIGALVAVAVIAILASFLYQRFFAQAKIHHG